MSTYKFKVNKGEEIDIPRICRENADQDAFVVISPKAIMYFFKSSLHVQGYGFSNCEIAFSHDGHVVTADFKTLSDWRKGWDYVHEDKPEYTAKARTETFFKAVAKAQEQKKNEIQVTVIAKD